MTSYSPEGHLPSTGNVVHVNVKPRPASLKRESGNGKPRDNTRAAAKVAREWQVVAEVLESCAYDIEKHYLGVSHTHEEDLEHAKRPGIAGKHYCGYREGHQCECRECPQMEG